MIRKLSEILLNGSMFDRFDPESEEDFLNFKYCDSRGVVTSVAIASVFLIAGLWIWDWTLDPYHAQDVIPTRLLMCLFMSIYPAAIVTGIRRSFLPWLLGLVVVSIETIFLYHLTLLSGGLLYGFAGFMYWYMLSAFAGLSFTFLESLLLNLSMAIVPNLLVLFGVAPHFDIPLYNALIWPTCCISIFGNLSLDRLYRRLFLYRRHIEAQARTDGLTGITNRSHFVEAAPVVVELCRRHDHPISVLMIDIDHFKKINDRYGHPEGDGVLRHVAETMRNKLRITDLLARYGGEEFVVILPETPPRSALIVAESIRRIIEETPVPMGPDRFIGITISAGVAGYDRLPDSIGLEDLLKQADVNLYEAKKKGRNRVECGVTAHLRPCYPA
ncbi:MAG: diguanylate cyclase [Geobacteraceae bacterium]|nr:diguanylate cyclase [Geobacteraceae bacterium]